MGRSDDKLNQPGPSNPYQENQQPSQNDSLTRAEGVRCSLHGTIYQLKLSMLFLQTALKEKYKFKLYSEKRNAENFDDVIFQYDRDRDRQYRFLQAKHILYPGKNKISVKKLCSEISKQPFNLQKYFISFRKIEQHEDYKGKIKDFIICTNTDFHDDIKIGKDCGRLTEVIEHDDILDIGKGRRYKFNFDKNKDIVDKLKEASDLNRLAKKLVKIIYNKDINKIDLKKALFKTYHVPLVKEVLDKSIHEDSKTMHYYCKFKKNFIEKINLSEEAELLHEAFWEEAKNRHVLNSIGTTIFDVSQKFGETTDEEKASEYLPNDSVTDDEIKKFFQSLIFAVEQPNEEKLGEFIQEKIFNSLDDLKDDLPAEIIYNHVLKELLDWLKSHESHPLTEDDNLFENAAEKLKTIMFTIPDIQYGSYITQKGITFKDIFKESEEFDEFLQSKDNVLNLISSEKNIFLSQTKYYQVKKQQAFYLRILLSLKKCGKNITEKEFRKNLLIIICKNESKTKNEDIKELYDELANLVKKDPNKKIVLITQVNSAFANFFKESYLKNRYREKSVETSIRELDQKYIEEKLLKRTIKFQGQKRNLKYVIGIEGKKINNELSEEGIQKLEVVVDNETLNELIADENIVVGDVLNFKDTSSPYYDRYHIDITRTFTHQIISRNLLKMCIKKRINDLFAFCSTAGNYLNNLVPEEEEKKVKVFSKRSCDETFFNGRFFVLDSEDPERDFKKLFSNSNGKNVHYLTTVDNNTGDTFILVHSTRLADLRTVIEIEEEKKELKDSVENYSIKKTEDLTDSLVIIAGDPGIGKSTVLTTCSQKLGQYSWVIRVNLKNHDLYIEKANFNNLDGIIEFFCNINLEGLKTALAKSLLRYRLECQGQVILLLDGYDEIKNVNQENVIKLLKTLKDTKGIVWLTTRLNKLCEVENALGKFSYCLNPFDEQQQQFFLKQFWINKLNGETLDNEKEGRLDKFTEDLLNNFHELGIMKNMKRGNFIGIVLQTRMVAEIFQDECRKNLKSKNVKSSNFRINNIFDLYEKFIEYQYERYFTERIKIGKYLPRGSQIALTRSYNKEHSCLALETLFSEDQMCKDLFRDKAYETFSQDELGSMGLIKNFKDTAIADFIHHTYAEYFVGKLLVHMLSKREDHPNYKLVHEFLLRNIFLDRNKVIQDFIEHEIKKKNDNELSRNWEAIQDRDLLRKIEKSMTLQLKGKNTGTEVQCDDVSENSLGELRKKIDKRIHGKYFNGKPEIFNQLYEKFLKEKDIKELRDTLIFWLKLSKDSFVEFSNRVFLMNNNISNAIEHFITQAKSNENQEIINEFLNTGGLLKNFETFQLIYEKLDSSMEEKHVTELTTFLGKQDDKGLNILSKVYPNISDIVKQNIDNIYLNKGLMWLERDGIKFARYLKILTPEMSKQFCSVIYVRQVFFSHMKSIQCTEMSGVNSIYVEKVFELLILPIEDMVKENKLHNIDVIAFLMLLVHFAAFCVINGVNVYLLKSDQIKITLKLIESVLKKYDGTADSGLSESTKYMFVLARAGLKLINANERLLVLDPSSEFRYELSSCTKQIVERIESILKNGAEADNKTILQVSKSPQNLKRSISVLDSQESNKIFKSDAQQ